MQIGKILRNLRLKKGISIKKLAPELGLDYTYISKLENARVMPSPDVIERVSNYFKYDSDALMLAAGKVPKDIKKILQDNPQEAVKYLRKKYGRK